MFCMLLHLRSLSLCCLSYRWKGKGSCCFLPKDTYFHR